ncbi:hypothetical protein ACHAWF_018668 [Thalassiosira exigua]
MSGTVHSLVSAALDRVVFHFSDWRGFDSDAPRAAAAGFVLGGVVLAILAAFPGNRTWKSGAPSRADGVPPRTGSPATKPSDRPTEDDSLSALQILNGSVYLLLLSGMVYFLNRDYDGLVLKWFVATFPREAETLGLGLRGEL